MVRTLIRYLPALLWMAVIFALSSQSALPPPPGISSTIASVIGHLVIYFTLACLLAFALAPDWRLTRTRMVTVIVICVFYGVSDEIHQSFVEGRTASVFDVVVDAVGALVGVWVSAYLLGWLAVWRNE
jgi:VanZ family protein